jgi:hypothetical protein
MKNDIAYIFSEVFRKCRLGAVLYNGVSLEGPLEENACRDENSKFFIEILGRCYIHI